MKRELLRDYLEKVRLLEVDLYTMEQTIKDFEDKIIQNNKQLSITQGYLPPKPSREEIKCRYSAKVEALNIYQIMGRLFVVGMTLGLGAIWYVIKERRDEENAINSMYNNELRKWENQNRTVIETKEKTNKYNRFLLKQIKETNLHKDKTAAALESLYEINVVYSKYRGLVPISMFCEYMDSNRRNKLEGKGEMYDLYEEELRSNLILDSLKEINNNLTTINLNLNSIQRNQMLTYEAISEGNRIAAQMASDALNFYQKAEDHFSVTERQLNSIATSSAASAYYDAANSRRIDAMSKIAEYNAGIRISPI